MSAGWCQHLTALHWSLLQCTAVNPLYWCRFNFFFLKNGLFKRAMICLCCIQCIMHLIWAMNRHNIIFFNSLPTYDREIFCTQLHPIMMHFFLQIVLEHIIGYQESNFVLKKKNAWIQHLPIHWQKLINKDSALMIDYRILKAPECPIMKNKGRIREKKKIYIYIIYFFKLKFHLFKLDSRSCFLLF